MRQDTDFNEGSVIKLSFVHIYDGFIVKIEVQHEISSEN